MQRIARALYGIVSLLACFVCASGCAATAYAQLTPDEASYRAAYPGHAPPFDFGSQPMENDFAEYDNDDDGTGKPLALLTEQGLAGACWEFHTDHLPLTSAAFVAGHHTLDPRPPRSI
jgi:hypothetical protein